MDVGRPRPSRRPFLAEGHALTHPQVGQPAAPHAVGDEEPVAVVIVADEAEAERRLEAQDLAVNHHRAIIVSRGRGAPAAPASTARRWPGRRSARCRPGRG